MDFILGLIFLIIAVVIFALSFSLTAMANVGIGPAFYPRLIAILTAMTALSLMYQSYNKIKNEESSDKGKSERSEPILNAEVIKILVAMIVYATLLRRIGYLIMTSVYLFTHFMIVTDKESRRIPIFILVSIVISVVTYYGFRNIFSVLLPSGILG